ALHFSRPRRHDPDDGPLRRLRGKARNKKAPVETPALFVLMRLASDRCLQQSDKDHGVADHAAEPGDGADAARSEARYIDDRVEHAGDDEYLSAQNAE